MKTEMDKRWERPTSQKILARIADGMVEGFVIGVVLWFMWSFTDIGPNFIATVCP